MTGIGQGNLEKLEIAKSGWKWLKVDGNDRKGLEMAGNGDDNDDDNGDDDNEELNWTGLFQV